ncbi:uncharacterized protein LOC127726006 [Mytilus californianus]|uniref:uncharacterized protein LOC127726006 n=1 Tax=Mytilus californianus TaxID=6549 RepID=UPI002246DA2E|nr:uncharacterized protein LOC127726006 [Mytilus californianus]
MAQYTAFDDTCDLSALLGIILSIDKFPQTVRNVAAKVRSDVRNPWAHCNFNKWDSLKYQTAFQLLHQLVGCLQLSTADEADILAELTKWEENGFRFLQGYAVSQQFVKEIRQQTRVLADYSLKMKSGMDETFINVHDALFKVNGEIMLACSRIGNIESKQNIQQILLDTIHEDVTVLYDRTLSFENTTKKVSKLENENRKIKEDISNIKTEITEIKDGKNDFRNDMPMSEPSGNTFFYPPNRSKTFVARETELCKIKDNCIAKCNGNYDLVICGLGGCGKTTLAIEFAWRSQEFYPAGVFWMSAETQHTLEDSFTTLAIDVDTTGKDFQETFKKTLKWFSNLNERWLLVVDNVDSENLSDSTKELLIGTWKRNTRGHIIITSRREPNEIEESMAVKSETCICLNVFETQEGLDFLMRRTEIRCNNDDDTVMSLVEELGGLPLALEQAAAHIKSIKCSFTDYVNKFKKKRLKLLKAAPSVMNTSKDRLAIATTWQLNIEYITRQSENEGLSTAAVTIMQVASFLFADDIPKEIINIGSPLVEDKVLVDVLNDEMGCSQIIEILTRFSLFQRLRGTSLSVHRSLDQISVSSVNEEKEPIDEQKSHVADRISTQSIEVTVELGEEREKTSDYDGSQNSNEQAISESNALGSINPAFQNDNETIDMTEINALSTTDEAERQLSQLNDLLNMEENKAPASDYHIVDTVTDSKDVQNLDDENAQHVSNGTGPGLYPPKADYIDINKIKSENEQLNENEYLTVNEEVKDTLNESSGFPQAEYKNSENEIPIEENNDQVLDQESGEFIMSLDKTEDQDIDYNTAKVEHIDENSVDVLDEEPDIDYNEKQNKLNGSVIFSFNDGDIKRHDCYYPDDKVFSLKNSGKQIFGITYPGRIFLTKQLDYEDGDRSFDLNITLDNRNRTTKTTVRVNVIDVDDMDPMFDHDDFNLQISENVSYSMSWQNTTPLISAHDRDSGTGKQDIEFAVYDNNDKRVFDLNRKTGEVKLFKIFDREPQSIYNYKIKVYQTNDHRRSATANLNIIVSDKNDNKPIFDKSEYYANVDEHSSKGTLVLRVHASDKDIGNNSVVRYSIETIQSLFQINENSGEILVANSEKLDREVNEIFILNIKATDSKIKDFNDQAKVIINILDKNDNGPVFTQNSYYFNSTGTSIIGQVVATDGDKEDNGKVVYHLESVQHNINLDTDTGRITMIGQLLADTIFRVKACDSAKIVSSRRCTFAQVFIHAGMVQVNSYNLTATVMENVMVGSYVSNIEIPGDRYEIINKNVPFTIDISSGIVRTRSLLDFDEGKQHFDFTIHVLNKEKAMIATVRLTVEVLDTNDNSPDFSQQLYTFALPEDVTVDTVIGVIKATDKDSGNNSAIQYSLQSSIDSTTFSVDSVGNIKMKDSHNDMKSLYQISVVASDGGVPQLRSFAQILITRVSIVGSQIKFGTPLEEKKLKEKKDELERQIGAILKIKAHIEGVKGVKLKNQNQQTRSYMYISGKYNNETTISTSVLRVMILEHMSEIQALFGNQRTVYLPSLHREGIRAVEIALIAISGVIFISSIIIIIVVRKQWALYSIKQQKFDRLHSNLIRKSSLYESQEIKVRLDDETSDYAGSLNTQEGEISQSSNATSLDATAFSNPVYESMHKTTMTISPSTVAATNEALESLQDLAERLNIEDKPVNVDGTLDEHSEQTFVKSADGTQIVTSVETYDDIDMSGYSNFEINEQGNITHIDSTNLMKFESDQSLFDQDAENGEHKYEDHENEPNIDYNDKQVRFSSIVLDTEDDVFKPLKEETITPAHFEYDSDRDDRESMGSSFPDLSKLMNHYSDETDRADEEIHSPIDFLKADEIRRTPTDNGTFHFGFGASKQDEITKF